MPDQLDGDSRALSEVVASSMEGHDAKVGLAETVVSGHAPGEAMPDQCSLRGKAAKMGLKI